MRNIDPDSEENQKQSRENEAYVKSLQTPRPLETSYFTFGQTHVHSVNGRTFDKDTVVKITSEDPRQTMFDTFGRQWAMEYDECPKLRSEGGWFREVVEL